VKSRRKTRPGPIKITLHVAGGEVPGSTDLFETGKPGVVLTHGEARGREPLAALIHRRHHLQSVLPVQGSVIEL